MSVATATRDRALPLDRVILIAWIVVFAAVRAGHALDTDPLWEIRAGQDLLAGVPLAHPDSWSWAPVSGLFQPNSPGWNVVLALSWRAASFWGLFVTSFLSICSVLGLLAYLALRIGAGYLATTFAVVVCSLGAYSMLSARPSVVAQGLLLLAIAVADRWADHARSRPAWVSALVLGATGFLVSGLGNWMHTSWGLLALALALSWALFWICLPGLSTPVRLAAVLGGTAGLVAGLLVGPYGLEVFARSAEVSAVASGLITEWIPAVDHRLLGTWLLPTVLVLVLAALSAIRVARHWNGRDRAYALEAALALIALPAAVGGVFVAVRLSGIAWLLVAPSLALSIRKAKGTSHDGLWRVVLGTVVVLLAPFAVLAAAERGQPPTLAALPALPVGCHLFSTEVDAASVLLLRPDVLVWFDGRTDYWGRARVEEATRRIYAPTSSAPVPPGTTCVLWPTAGTLGRVPAALAASTSWRQVGQADGYGVWVPAG